MNSSSDPTCTDTVSADLLATGNIPMPRLSDDAVVQIHDFIHHVLDLFEEIGRASCRERVYLAV